MLYQLSLILSPELNQNELAKIDEKIKQIVAASDGNISTQNPASKQKLAYPIEKYEYGNYINLDIELNPENIENLKKQINLDKDIIRFQITKAPKEILQHKPKKYSKKHEPIKISKETEQEIEEKIEKEIESKTEQMKEDKKEKAEKPEQKKEEQKHKDKERKRKIEELDKKLEEILGGEI